MAMVIYGLLIKMGSTLKIIGLAGIALSVMGLSYSQSKRFFDWLRFQSLGTRDYIVEKLANMFIDVQPNQVLIGLVSASVAFGGVFFVICLPRVFIGLPLGLVMGSLIWFIPKPLINHMVRKRTEKFVYQMVDGLNLMSNGLKSGLSVPQSFGLVTQEMPNPMQQEFGLVLNENKLGVSLEDALTNLSKRMVAEDVEMFVTSVNILKETGGNLSETFDTIVTTIRERIKVQKRISAMTAQGLMQGYFLLAVPPIMLVVFYQSDPEFMMPLFTHWLGWLILTVILLLEVTCFFVIMKIIKIEV